MLVQTWYNMNGKDIQACLKFSAKIIDAGSAKLIPVFLLNPKRHNAKTHSIIFFCLMHML